MINANKMKKEMVRNEHALKGLGVGPSKPCWGIISKQRDNREISEDMDRCSRGVFRWCMVIKHM